MRTRRGIPPVLTVLTVLTVLALAVFLSTAAAPRVLADDLPYPPGRSIQNIEERKVVLVLPDALSAESPASLLIILHGAGGTATGMAGSFTPWAKDGYVVCAVKARDATWEVDDLKRVRTIAAHLKEVLPIDAEKAHVVGYSNGGWNLHPLAFDDDLKPCSATWIAAGFSGGQIPKWAKNHLGAIALAGSEDGNNRSARQTVPALEDKVRSVEFREEPGLGHAFPRTLMPYLQWWMGVQEGRLTPGVDLSFEWGADLPAAIASQAGGKKGGVLLWLYTPTDLRQAPEQTKLLQNEVFFDPEVRFLGNQLACVKLDVSESADVLTEYKVKSTPALVVLDKTGKVKKTFEGKIKASKVARTLRSVAPQKSPPKR